MQLVREMVAVARSESGFFDQEALVRAISSDLELWDPTSEDTPTTYFYDVFGEAVPGVKTQLKADLTPEKKGETTVVALEAPHKGAGKTADDIESSDADPNTNNSGAEGEKEPRLGLCARCYKSLFPVVYANQKEKLF
jgi:hypothetical protein